MKTKLLFATLILITGLGILYIVSSQHDPTPPPAEGEPLALTAAATLTDTSVENTRPPETAPAHYRAAPGATSLHAVDALFETVDHTEFAGMLGRLELIPDSPVKTEMMREALMTWAVLDGAGAATWARQRGPCRVLLPEILQAWSGTGEESAVTAWAFAKTAFSTDRDETIWLAPGFVTSAFREMTAIPGDAVWNELANLSGAVLTAAIMGMADFASNRQVNTDFTAAMERRVLDYESPSLAAAFYASAGHIQAAKNDLASVTDSVQWHAIAREIARQQAEFEPAKAIEWLQSQFMRPEDGIADVVEGVGMTHALNAGDVLRWLRALPSSETVTAGIEKIEAKFPMLRPGIGMEVISMEGDP